MSGPAQKKRGLYGARVGIFVYFSKGRPDGAADPIHKEIEIRPIVRKDLKTDRPWAETKTHWIFMGYDEDLMGDCRVTQVVDIRKGVHCMIPKAVFVKLSHH
jgi:acetamidase/formamidase